MDKYLIVHKIEEFAPLEIAEPWDCSGWLVETDKKEISKIMLALTVTDDIIRQANESCCDMIISHHPLFKVPVSYKNIDIYCAHTNMDLANGGTTDSLIDKIQSLGLPILRKFYNEGEFARYIETDISDSKLMSILSKISPNFRYTNPTFTKNYKKLAICAGSGSEFINEAFENGADAFITGDLKFHTALESKIPIFDIGHFESEIQVLDIFKQLIGYNVDVIKAEEVSPFKLFRI